MVCLERAGLPEPLQKLVRALLVNVSVLFLNGIEYDPLQCISGLTQGRPARCILKNGPNKGHGE